MLRFFQELGRNGENTVSINGRRYIAGVNYTLGGYGQESPFKDGTASGAFAEVCNLDSGEALHFDVLSIDLIERYGFYQGHGTQRRVDPENILRVLEFLRPDLATTKHP